MVSRGIVKVLACLSSFPVLLTGVQAYYLHPSSQSIPFMQPSVEKSFLWADITVDLAKKNNAYLRSSGNELFMQTQYLKKAMHHLQGLAKASEYKSYYPPVKLPQMSKDEFIIFAGFEDLTEITTAKGVKQWRNSELGFAEVEDLEGAFMKCKNSDISQGLISFAYVRQSLTGADIIRICPLFLSYIAKERWPDASKVNPKWLVDVPPEALKLLEREGQLPIDLYALFEKSLLHEMTHTKVGGGTKDIKGKMFTGVNIGYRYAASLTILAWEDAEANAFLGLIGWLLYNGLVHQFGKLVSIEPQTNTGSPAPQKTS